MIETKKQRIIFGVMMSYIMAIGMEVYNKCLNAGGFDMLSYQMMMEALIEVIYMGIIVFIFSSLWGNKKGEQLMNKYTSSKDSPYFRQLIRQAGTVSIMCPTMSLTATILFHIILGGAAVIDLPVIFLGTLFKNFPMAFFWNMFMAAPLTHWLFQKIFYRI